MGSNTDKLEELIRKYNSGKCSPAEKAWLEAWYRSFELNKNDNISSDRVDQAGSEVWTMMEEQLAGQMQHVTPSPAGKLRLLQLWRYAAVFIGITLLSAGIYYYTRPPVQSAAGYAGRPTDSTGKDILPGKPRAALTLSDGSILSLDSMRNLQFKEKDGTLIAKDADKLVYNDDGGDIRETSFNTLSTPRGGEYQLQLPDGTRVWLNAASSLEFPTRFNGPERMVYLKGEAYFEVAKNRHKPFIVSLDDQTAVEVLGTSFNIMNYDDESEAKATLIEGKVKVTRNLQSTLLSPSRQAVMKRGSTALEVVPANVESVLAWKNGMIEFNGDNLPYVMRQISRWYDVEVAFENEPSKGSYAGAIPRTVSLSKVLDVLKLAGVRFRLEQQKLIITGE